MQMIGMVEKREGFSGCIANEPGRWERELGRWERELGRRGRTLLADSGIRQQPDAAEAGGGY